MNDQKNAEIVKTRISEQRNCKSPALLLHNLLTENRIKPKGLTEGLLKEAIQIENEIEKGLDPLLEIAIVLQTKELINKCETIPTETHNGKKCPNLRLFLSYGTNPKKWSIGAVVKYFAQKKQEPISALASASNSIDSLPPLIELTLPSPAALQAEEICDNYEIQYAAYPLNSDFSDDDIFITAVSQSNQTIPPEVFSDSSPTSPIIKPCRRARKRKATTLAAPKKRTKK